MIVLALAFLAAPGAGQDVWAQLWTELDRLHEESVPQAEAASLRAHLAEAAQTSAADPRAELLRAELEHLAGRDVSALAERIAAREPDPFTPREHWFLADALPLGATRVRTLLAALEAPADLERWKLFLVFNTYVDEARALRFQGSALALQRRLYERYQAEWIALDLSLSLKAVGEYEAADRVLAETIERETAAGRRPKVLWEHRGILALGSGDDRRARDYLGKALALGSDDAGLLLSRMDLMEGRTDAARRGFRALILNDPPPDWAWRGWGTALLPTASAAPARRSPANE